MPPQDRNCDESLIVNPPVFEGWMEEILAEEEWLWSSEEEEDEDEDQAPAVPGPAVVARYPWLPLQGDDVHLEPVPELLAQGAGPGASGSDRAHPSSTVEEIEDMEEGGHSPSPVFDSDESPPPPYEGPPRYFRVPDMEEDDPEEVGPSRSPVFGPDESPPPPYEGPPPYFYVNPGPCSCRYCLYLAEAVPAVPLSWSDAEEEQEEEESRRSSAEPDSSSSMYFSAVEDMELSGPSSPSTGVSYVTAWDSSPPSPSSSSTSSPGSSPETESSYLSD